MDSGHFTGENINKETFVKCHYIMPETMVMLNPASVFSSRFISDAG